MVESEPSRLTRRTLLAGAAVFAAESALGSPALAHERKSAVGTRPVHSGEGPRVHAAVDRNGELLVLTATDTEYTLNVLEADGPTAAAELGPSLPLSLPADFHPHSMAVLGPVLWITGALETEPDRARPALVRVENGAAVYAALPIPSEIGSGLATAITTIGSEGLAVAVEGGPDSHLTALTRSHLALSSDGGRTWTERPLATGLGEGYGTAATATARGLFAIVADGDATQTVHIAFRGTRPRRVATVPEAGRPMAAVATDAGVSVFSDRDGTVIETRYTAAGAPLESTANCGCRGEVFAVPGRPGAWLETDGATVRIRGTT